MSASEQGFSVLTGFTAPTTIYEKMRRIDAAAENLNRDVLGNVAEGGYRSAWKAWFANWKAFFAKTMDEKVANVLRTDALDAEVDRKAAEFEGFRRSYPDQKTSDGRPVPPSSQPVPVEMPKKGADGGSALPWWFWVGATVAAAGVGYVGYRYYQEAQAKKRVIEKEVLPGVLGGFLGPKTGGALARAAAARDASPSDDPALILALSKDPAAIARYQAFAYRPMQHPHVVPLKERLPPIASVVSAPRPYEDPFHSDNFDPFDGYDPYY